MELHQAVDRWKEDLNQIRRDRENRWNKYHKKNEKVIKNLGHLKSRLFMERDPAIIDEVILVLEAYDRMLDLIFFRPRDRMPNYLGIHHYLGEQNSILSNAKEKLLNKSEYELKFFLKKCRFPFLRKPKYDFDIVIDFIDDYYDYRRNYQYPQEQLAKFWEKHNI